MWKEAWSTKGRSGLWKEGIVSERKILSMKVLFSYIAFHLHIFVTKWTNYEMMFLSMKGRFLSMKGRFYLRKEGFINVYIVVLPYICYKINKLLFGRKVWSTKGRFGLWKEGIVSERKILSMKGRFYKALHLHIFVTKWTNYEMIFCLRKEDFCLNSITRYIKYLSGPHWYLPFVEKNLPFAKGTFLSLFSYTRCGFHTRPSCSED